MLFIETSAKTAFNVEEAFQISAENILKNMDHSSFEEKVKFI
jgi:hypothetical protein